MRSPTTRTAWRMTAVTAGALLLSTVGAVAANAEDPPTEGSVDVNVAIESLAGPGVLAMTVGGTSVNLEEAGSTATVRQFTGTLPTVTVTDTRTAEEIPDGAFWYVLGSTSGFIGDSGQATIGAEHLGWAPALIDGGESGQVDPGEAVDTVADIGDADPSNNTGLIDQELLASAFESEAAAPDGSWTANAELFLRTPVNVAAGNYTSVLTLSLFE